jgi:hypothetical protein
MIPGAGIPGVFAITEQASAAGTPGDASGDVVGVVVELIPGSAIGEALATGDVISAGVELVEGEASGAALAGGDLVGAELTLVEGEASGEALAEGDAVQVDVELESGFAFSGTVAQGKIVRVNVSLLPGHAVGGNEPVRIGRGGFGLKRAHQPATARGQLVGVSVGFALVGRAYANPPLVELVQIGRAVPKYEPPVVLVSENEVSVVPPMPGLARGAALAIEALLIPGAASGSASAGGATIDCEMVDPDAALWMEATS